MAGGSKAKAQARKAAKRVEQGASQSTGAATYPTRGDILEEASQANSLLMKLMSDPRLNRSDPAASPKPLFFTCDFLRRTYLEYLMPLMPREAPLRLLAYANPFLFDYPEDKIPGESDAQEDVDYIENEANWPPLNAARRERFNDAIGRGVMIRSIIDEAGTEGSRGAMILGSTFEFSDEVKQYIAEIKAAESEAAP